MNHTPDNGFEFPNDKRDQIDKMLRASDERQPLRSVRPERNPVVTPTLFEEQEPTQTVAVTQPPITASSDPEGVSLDLPSRFFYYTFKDLYVKPFRVRHMAKIAKANENSSFQILAEAVSSVLSTSSGEKNLAFKLSMADFNFVLYWLRLNSFNKPQMRVTSVCNNPEHLRAVDEGTKTKESLNITTIYKESMIETIYLESAPDSNVYKIDYKGRVLVLRPETVMDVVEFLDDPDWQDEEFQYQARMASVIEYVPDPNEVLTTSRLRHKMKIVEDLDPDQGLLAHEFAELVDSYGVNETIKTNCIGCGASGLVKIAVDAPSFLSPQF